MKLRYMKPGGQRRKRDNRYMFFHVFILDKSNDIDVDIWYCEYKDGSHRWAEMPSIENVGTLIRGKSTLHVSSHRAFRRLLKKWAKDVPKGTTFRMLSCLKAGYDIIGKT